MAATHQPRNKNRKRHVDWSSALKRRFQKPITVASEIAGMPFTISVVDDTNQQAAIEYVEAHALLPWGFDATSAAWAATVAEAFAALGDALTRKEAWLRAIVILGHTPTQEALATLRRHAASGAEHADIAAIAADECEDWIRRAGTNVRLLK